MNFSSEKRYALALSFLFFPLMLFAQQNLREGYVITLQGDTLQGVIDYRTADMNTKRCVFKQDGTDEFKTYLPGEIDGYRFINNGIYYISKEIKKDEYNKEMVFAEYVLRGSMNLYQVGANEMVLENEDGDQASYSLEDTRNASGKKELRQKLYGVLNMLNKSQKAQNMLFEMDKNRDNAKRAVKAYVSDACPDGFCEEYEYKSKKTPTEDKVFHPWIKLGLKYTQYKFWNNETLSGLSPQISAGGDIHVNRLLKGLMVNVGVAFEMAKASQDINKLAEDYEDLKKVGGKPLNVDFKQLDIMVGPGYQFKTGSFNTRIKAGVIYRCISRDFKYINGHYRYWGKDKINVGEINEDLRFDTQIGFYGGIGIEYPLKKFSIICDLDYIYDYNEWTKCYDHEKTVVKQNGICLSAGIKF